MKSNFDFLSRDFPVLANFGKLAEQYCFSDANSCLIKLGMIGENIVNLIFTYDGIDLPYDNTAVTRIDTLMREGLLTRDLCDILHAIRKARNKATHENYGSTDEAKTLLQMTYSLCEWFMQTYGDWNYQNQPFVMPSETEMSNYVVADKEQEKKFEDELTKEAEKTALSAPKVSQEERRKQSAQIDIHHAHRHAAKKRRDAEKRAHSAECEQRRKRHNQPVVRRPLAEQQLKQKSKKSAERQHEEIRQDRLYDRLKA